MVRPSSLHRAPLALAALSFALAPALAAQNGAVIRGRVLGPAGQPLAGALVIKTSPTVDTVRADTAGRYAVSRLMPGHYVFEIRQSGYSPMEMELNLTGDTTLEVDVPLELAALDVSAATLDQVGFTRRKADNHGRRGVAFIGPDEIAARNATKLTDLLAGITDVQIRPEGRYAAIWGDGARCAMPVWVDGHQSTDVWPYQDRGLDEAISLDRVAAIEVYPRDTQVPREFQQPSAPMPARYSPSIHGSGYQAYDTRTVHCGVILVWTK